MAALFISAIPILDGFGSNYTKNHAGYGLCLHTKSLSSAESNKNTDCGGYIGIVENCSDNVGIVQDIRWWTTGGGSFRITHHTQPVLVLSNLTKNS